MAISSAPQYGIVVSRDVMVEMRDGVRLATDVYRPANPDGTPAEGRFPVVLGRTSYDKSNPVMWIQPVADFFTPRGYVVMLQDLRGRGRSEGTGQYFHTANVNEGPDGYDTIEWAAAQAWSNGRTGMVGSSHGGIVQNMASLYRPPHLSALWVDVAPTNAFKWEARQGGAMGLHMYGAMYLHGFDSQEIQGDSEAVRRIEEGAENLREGIWDMPLRPGETPIAAVPNLEKVLFHYYYDGAYNDWWATRVSRPDALLCAHGGHTGRLQFRLVRPLCRGRVGAVRPDVEAEHVAPTPLAGTVEPHANAGARLVGCRRRGFRRRRQMG